MSGNVCVPVNKHVIIFKLTFIYFFILLFLLPIMFIKALLYVYMYKYLAFSSK